MPVERAADHPISELAGNAITSLAGPSRGADELALFRTVLPPGDSVVVPIGAWHPFVADDAGATLIVTMVGGTRLIREDGTEIVPPWVG